MQCVCFSVMHNSDSGIDSGMIAIWPGIGISIFPLAWNRNQRLETFNLLNDPFSIQGLPLGLRTPALPIVINEDSLKALLHISVHYSA